MVRAPFESESGVLAGLARQQGTAIAGRATPTATGEETTAGGSKGPPPA